MTDYTKLVKELRGCKYIDYCKDCPRMAANGYVEICNIKDDAAAAIEALETEIRESMQKCAECGDKCVEVVRCKECVHYNAGFECLAEGYGIEREPDWYCAYGKKMEVQE